MLKNYVFLIFPKSMSKILFELFPTETIFYIIYTFFSGSNIYIPQNELCYKEVPVYQSASLSPAAVHISAKY